MRIRWLVHLALTLVLTSGCSLLSDFPRYHAANDGGGVVGMDGGDAGTGDAGMTEVCTPACGEGESCVAGLCRCGAGAACGDGEACCDDLCVSLDSLGNCGGCGMACGPFTNASARCEDGDCFMDCIDPYTDCDTDRTTGCEASLFDHDTCGECDNPCDVAEVCTAVAGVGTCASDCAAGETPCNGSCFAEGGDCACGASPVSGTLECDPALGPSCDYPAEVCNGIDDNCDGAIDETFDCLAGTSAACTVTMSGCTANGTSMCSSSCSMGTCVVSEACNRIDGDCDGFVDEGLLVPGASRTVSGSANALRPRGAWNPLTNQIGLLWGENSGGATTLFFASLGVDGALVSGPTSVDDASSWDITFDGNTFTIAWSRGSASVYVARVDTAAAAIITGPRLTPASLNSTSELAIARTGAADQVTVAWFGQGAGTSFEAWQAQVRTPSGGFGSSMLSMNPVFTGSLQYMLGMYAENVGSGALIGFAYGISPSIPFAIAVRQVLPDGSIGISRDIETGPEYEGFIEAAYDPVTGRTGLVWIQQDTGGNAFLRLATLAPSTFAASTVVTVSPSASPGVSRRPSIAASGDGTFGVAYFASDGSNRFSRHRANDGTIVPESTITAPGYLTRVGGSDPVRYLSLSLSSSGRVVTQPVQCR